jgi:hypothetical protein
MERALRALGGDTDLLPARYGWSMFGEPTERSIPTDMYFACLDGNWNLNGNHIYGEAAVNVTDPAIPSISMPRSTSDASPRARQPRSRAT